MWAVYQKPLEKHMPVIDHSVLVTYSPEEMVALVNNIEDYKDFVKYCTSSVVNKREGNAVEATLTLSAGPFTHSFTTRNTLAGNRMDIALVDGPFSALSGFWEFINTDNGTLARLNLSFEFSSRVLAIAVQPIFTKVSNEMIGTFVKRAKIMYGERNVINHDCPRIA